MAVNTKGQKIHQYPWQQCVPMIIYQPTKKKILFFILLILPSLKFQAPIFDIIFLSHIKETFPIYRISPGRC